MSHLSSVVFFVVLVLVWPLVGWSASCGKLARCGRAGIIWGTFSNPFLHAKVGSAVLKRAAQSPWMLPNASSALGKETNDHWSKGHLHAGLWLQLPVITFTYCFATLLLLHVLWEEEKCRLTGYTDKTCGEKYFKVGKSLHRDNPTLSASEVWVQWYDESSWLETTLAAVDGQVFFGALMCHMHSTMHCWTAFMFIEPYCWFPLPNLPEQSSHAMLSKTCLTEGLRPLGYTWSSLPVKWFTWVWPLSHAMSTWTHRWELGEWATLKRHDRPPTRGTTPPQHPIQGLGYRCMIRNSLFPVLVPWAWRLVRSFHLESIKCHQFQICHLHFDYCQHYILYFYQCQRLTFVKFDIWKMWVDLQQCLSEPIWHGQKHYHKECNHGILQWKTTVIHQNRCIKSWSMDKSSASERQSAVPKEWNSKQCSTVANSIHKQKLNRHGHPL